METISDIKKIIKSKVFKNFSYLSFFHIISFVFPLLTFPYITRIFGPEGYGLINFLQSFVAYFAVIADYGLGIIAPGLLSVEKQNLKKFSIIFHSVLFIKFFISIICLSLIFFISFFSEQFYSNINLIFIIFLGSVMFANMYPGCFFQAIEEMKYITYMNVFIKLIFIISLFLFVHSSKDLSIYLWLNTISNFLSAIIAFLIIYIKFKLVFSIPKLEDIKDIFKKSTISFMSVLCSNTYTISNYMFLGFFWNEKEVGFYSGTYKIIYYILSFVSLFSQALYPKMSVISKSSIYEAYKIVKKSFIYVFPFVFLISLVIFLMSEKITLFLLGYEFKDSYKALRIMSLIPIFIFISNMIGIQIILASQNLKLFLRMVLSGVFFNLACNFFITIKYGYIGASISFVLTEFFIAIYSFVILKGLLKNA